MEKRRKPGFFMILFRSFFFRRKNYWKFTFYSCFPVFSRFSAKKSLFFKFFYILPFFECYFFRKLRVLVTGISWGLTPMWSLRCLLLLFFKHFINIEWWKYHTIRIWLCSQQCKLTSKIRHQNCYRILIY